MIRYLFAALLLIHGLVHIMGFAKAFGYGDIKNLSGSVSQPAGMLWFSAFLLFMIALALFIFHRESWRWITIIAVLLSQVLVISVWKDAWAGTIVNVLIIAVIIYSYNNTLLSNART